MQKGHRKRSGFLAVYFQLFLVALVLFGCSGDNADPFEPVVEKWVFSNPVEFNNYVSSTAMVSEAKGFVCGTDGQIYQTNDRGESWSTIVSNTELVFLNMAFANPDTGMAFGFNGKVLVTHNGGEDWAISSCSHPNPLEDGTFSTPSTAFVVGWAGIIHRSTDAGRTWAEVNPPSSSGLEGVAFADSLHGVAVGLNGIMFRTSDGGLSWSEIESGTSAFLLDVEFFSPTTGFAVGRDGTLLKSTDTGLTWAQVEGIGEEEVFTSISTSPNGVGIIGGSILMWTADYGANWDVVEETEEYGLGRVSLAPEIVGLGRSRQGVVTFKLE